MKLENKRILITGGTTGIGRELALQLIKKGAHVITFGRTEKPLEELSTLSNRLIFGINADVSDVDEIARVFKFIDEQTSGLDILINNAALGDGNLQDESPIDIKYMVETNLLGYLLCTKYALERMKDKGHIINIGSMTAETLESGSEVYTATKAAVGAFSKSIQKAANEKGIKVTLIEPGSVDTDMQLLPRDAKDKLIAEYKMLKTEDIANTIIFCLEQNDRIEISSIQIKALKQII